MNKIKRTAPVLMALLALTLLILLTSGCDSTGESGTGATTTDRTTATSEAGSGPKRFTLAPDLEAVGNFRPGPPDDAGNHRTSVDFIFDQQAYLTGGNRTSFHLVPEDGGEVLDGSDAVPEKDSEGDAVVTAIFPGKLEPGNFARGYVAPETVSSDKQGDAPTNIGQAARVSENGTPDPDLVSVTKDADQFLFEFDQPLTQDDVVQDNGGLRLYFPDTRNTGATAVDQTGDPKVLRATFKGLPGDLSLQDAVGGFVTQGTVQARTGENESGGPNAFDEVAPLKDTSAEVCPAPETAGKSGSDDGPTAAPDLLSIENFRRGPVTAQGEPRTCVDFVFDQKAYLKGGNRTSFHLIPANGGDVLDAGDVIPESDKEGDALVSAVFPGALSPEDFPRGYVDSKMLTSRKAGANRENPFNINQTASISHEGKTENPDLVSVKRDGDQVLYQLDQPLTEDDVVQNTGGLRLYFSETDTSSIREAGAQAVKRRDETTLRAYFGRDLPGGKSLADAIGGYVTQGAVQSAEGSRGANDGKSAFDELYPIEDTGTVVCPAPDSAVSDGRADGPTEAPDLVEVGNFRRGPFTSQFTPTTCVDFTFDQAAYLTGSNRTSFHLVARNGSDALDAEDVIPRSDKEGDRVITAAFPGNLDPKNFARGYVDKEVLSSSKKGNTPTNVPHAEDIGETSSTSNPDLLSVTKDADQFLFEFDQPLTQDDVVQDTGGLRLYFPNTSQTQATAVDRTDDPKVLRATFKQLPEGLSLAEAVGGFVTQGAVQGTGEETANAFDEIFPLKDTGAEVCPASENAGEKGEGKGPTSAPDLVGVGNFRRGLVTDQGEPRTCVDFTFDQKTFLTGGNRSSFHLAPKKGGDALDATNIVPDKDVSGDTTITVMFPGNLNPEDFARGYIDGKIAASGTGGDEPTNVGQAEDVEGGDGMTVNPDLVSITGDCDRLLFEFDQPLTQDDVVQDSAGLQVYYGVTRRFASERVETTDDPSVLAVFYAKEVKIAKASGGVVTQGTVQGQPSGGNTGGPNAFDEVSLEDTCNESSN